MPFRRRLLTWVVLALVVVVGTALGRAPDVGVAAVAAPAVAPVEAVLGQVPDVVSVPGAVGEGVDVAPRADHGDGAAPCVLRSDCAGAWTFGAVGLLLAVAVTVPAVGVVPTVRRVVAAPAALHSALLPSGLFRPPQTS